jgi:hypothetical protein
MLILCFSFPDTPETSKRIGESTTQTSLSNKGASRKCPHLQKLRFILMQAFRLKEGETLLDDDYPVCRILG